MSRILLLFAITTGLSFSANRPNIVAIISEDMGPDLGCWGAKVHTPHIDSLASSGMRFTHCFGTASVCMPNRTAMITGMYQPSIGSVTMRPPAKFRATLPEGIAPLPYLLRNHGYRTANIVDKKNIGSGGKDDWNFNFEGKSWDTKNLADLTPDKPFYAQFNFPMAHRPFRQDKEHPIDPATVDLPPYYPNHPVARQAWSDYLESIQNLDRNVGEVLAWLEEKKLTENTIIFCFSDHGEAFLRGKYWLYDCSLNQHLIVRWPEKLQPPKGYQTGGTSSQLVAAIDIMAQTLAAADHPIPAKIHARPFLGDGVKPRSEIYSASDWIGGSKIKSRSIRTARYKYIRNYNTDLSITSASTEYRKVEHPMYHLVNILAEQNKLSPLHRKLLHDKLPEEEFYDLQEDPHELHNLANSPEQSDLKKQLREKVEAYIKTSGDKGFEPLSPDHIKHFETYKKNGAKKWTKRRNKLRQEVLDQIDQN